MPSTTSPSASIHVSAAHRPAPEQLAIARLAEELGFDGMAMPDHLFVPARDVDGYPYSEDGRPPFDQSTLWTDVLVLAAAAAAQTTRLCFGTCIYLLPLRHPLVVARALATVEALAPGRVWLGVGVGWMRAEFDALGVDYHRRGALTDEAIELLRKLWAGGLVSHDGPSYPLEPMYFEPHPSAPIPILVGGTSAPALARAARLGDGYVAMPAAVDALVDVAARLRELRARTERARSPFLMHAWALADFTLEDYRRLVEAGVTTFYVPAMGTLAEIREHLARFQDVVGEPLRASGHLAVPAVGGPAGGSG